VKILTITDYPGSWPYVPELLENLHKFKNVQTGILDIFNLTYKKTDGSEIKYKRNALLLKIPVANKFYKYTLGKKILREVEKDYDIVNIHFLAFYYILFAKDIKKLGKKLILSVWGSDFYRVNKVIKRLLNIIFKRADIINFLNPETAKYFLQFYKRYENKVKLLHYGLHSLDVIKNIIHSENQAASKKTLGIAENSLVICCAYNGSPGQQHLSILKEIYKISPQLPNNYLLVVPLTYATPIEYKEEIIRFLNESKFNYKIFDKMLDNEDLARLRIASDIIITMQITDQLSASIQEIFFCGNLVISGAWLPYKVFEDKGIFFIKTVDFESLSVTLLNSINTFGSIKAKCSTNPEKIYKFSNWQDIIQDWINLYST
jgi:hypothetical protein